MKQLFIIALLCMGSVVTMGQRVTRQILYSYEYDMQKYEYIKQLDYADGQVVLVGERQVILNGQTYHVVSKDREVSNERQRSLQYTVTDEGGAEYIICFNEELTFPEELRHQVVFFSANSPYHWTYYITNEGK